MGGTFIFERMMGVFVYAVTLLLFYFLLFSNKTTKEVSRTLNVYLIILCLLAYFYIPAETADLYRWLNITNTWNRMSLGEFAKTYLFTSSTPVAYLMMYICSFFNNDGVLPMLCALIFFSNYFYILKDLNKRHGIDSRGIASSLLFVMSSGCFLEVISGVRCLVSLSILAKCFYDELYNRKSLLKHIPLAVIASLMHSMALIVYAIWLLFRVFINKQSLKKKILSVCGIVLMGSVFVYLGRSYIESGIDRAFSYLTGNGTYFYIWEYIIRLITSICIILILARTRNVFNSNEYKNVFKFNILLIIIETFLLFEYNTFHRLTTLTLLMSTPIICKYLVTSNQKNRNQNLFIVSIIVLAIACVRGNLCGYKFWS